jgi:hypothetical protein
MRVPVFPDLSDLDFRKDKARLVRSVDVAFVAGAHPDDLSGRCLSFEAGFKQATKISL